MQYISEAILRIPTQKKISFQSVYSIHYFTQFIFMSTNTTLICVNFVIILSNNIYIIYYHCRGSSTADF
jgi:hypothetical protein